MDQNIMKKQREIVGSSGSIPFFIPSSSTASSSSSNLVHHSSTHSVSRSTNPSLSSLSSRTFPPFLTVPSSSSSSNLSGTLKIPSESPTLLTAPLPSPFFFQDAPHPRGLSASKGTSIMWFRSDLRVHDNPALTSACENSSKVIPLYVFDPRHFGKTAFGFEKTGRYRAKFLVESVNSLRNSLKKLGNTLAVRKGTPETVLIELCKEFEVETVYFHQEVTYEEQQVEREVEKVLEKNGITVKKLWANTLYHAEDLPFEIERMPDVYTEFREKVELEGSMRAPLEIPESVPMKPEDLDEGMIPTLKELGLEEPVGQNSNGNVFVGGEDSALDRLSSYLKDTCGSMMKFNESSLKSSQLGADFSCKISPWLALGCVSPRKIVSDLRSFLGSMNDTHGVMKSTTYYELVWRDFFRFITLKYGAARLNKTNDKLQTSKTTTHPMLAY
eukprot:CAMPEP_0182446638 /NCGR_PEP_ID=MMETSP1172-20130603/4319_1 /TAXON_ID=708627 /ORGANISM="Timspurckia oligopyrenoides, Strain CCMP3278" /LENGTH=442 /DNA_ID=CAMNT_0024642591 /DNA_START=27 /DNA_END=1355 /DNA_ORIENTATION=-